MVIAFLAVASVPAPAPATDVGVIAGHTWTRNEVLGVLPTRPPANIVGTGRCFTISVPYTRHVSGPWSWTIQPTSYHLEYKGPGISSAEVPVTLRWSAPTSGWMPYAEIGPSLHYGAGLSSGDERRAHFTPCIDAGVGVTRAVGARRATFAVRTVSAPQHGEWARRIALLAGVLQSVTPRDASAPPPLPPGGRPREGSLLGSARIAGIRVGVLGGFLHAEAEPGARGDILYAGQDSIAGGDVRETISPIDAPLVSLALDVLTTSRVALSLQPSLASVVGTHTYAADNVPVAHEEARSLVFRMPIQVRVSLSTGALQPYVALGPTFASGPARGVRQFSVVRARPITPGPGGGRLDENDLVARLFNPTFGVTARIADRSLYAEARSLITATSSRWRDEYSVVLGVDLTRSRTHGTETP
jgi:hypothetical protein